MPSLAIPNVPDEVYERIQEAAKVRGRSVEQEAVEILNKWLEMERAEARILDEARENREELARKGVFLTDADLKAAIEWGRK